MGMAPEVASPHGLGGFAPKAPPVGKTAYTMRVKGVIKSQKAQTVAGNFARRLRKACKQVKDRGGAAADN